MLRYMLEFDKKNNNKNLLFLLFLKDLTISTKTYYFNIISYYFRK